MKKILSFIAIVIFIAATATSCTKSCKCYNSNGMLAEEYSKKNKKEGCSDFDKIWSDIGGRCAME